LGIMLSPSRMGKVFPNPHITQVCRLGQTLLYQECPFLSSSHVPLRKGTSSKHHLINGVRWLKVSIHSQVGTKRPPGSAGQVAKTPWKPHCWDITEEHCEHASVSWSAGSEAGSHSKFTHTPAFVGVWSNKSLNDLTRAKDLFS
jgi:hypothetical protein